MSYKRFAAAVYSIFRAKIVAAQALRDWRTREMGRGIRDTIDH
jgi:hypothetical protein